MATRNHSSLQTPSISGEEVLPYYRTRFQIEFCFREAKGYTGLMDCQARDKRKLDFAFNASFTSLNVAKVTMKEMGMEYSMSSFKSLMTSMYEVKRIYKSKWIHPKTNFNLQDFQRSLILTTYS